MSADCMCNVCMFLVCRCTAVSGIRAHDPHTGGCAVQWPATCVPWEATQHWAQGNVHRIHFLFKIPPALFKCTLHISAILFSSKLQHVIKSNATHLPSKGMASVHGYWTTNSHSPSGFCCTSKQNKIKSVPCCAFHIMLPIYCVALCEMFYNLYTMVWWDVSVVWQMWEDPTVSHLQGRRVPWAEKKWYAM
jgi:hypothetical protein